MIRLKNIVKKYSTETEIGFLNFSIENKGINSIIGPNGAGKSTTLLMIGRLLGIDEGEIFVGDYDVSKTDGETLSKVISTLRQENNFMARLTVRQLISFGRFPYTKGRLTINDHRIIEKYIDFLELNGLENRYLNELSGSQRQRAYVAMVLAQETEYVLLDEPLNNLDVARSVSMMKHLRNVCDKLGRTIILVIHDINFAAKYSDKIFAMKNGQLVKLEQ
ncbi:ATP-binding cassette domain-containing protein [uncultured Anaerococcus sp.]|uniref:iron ABC transporter ATP-binding protein n=1 Tax=uncultured Anaerococcus sp. TaxID=293428 RepID=UPI00261AF517|nr:ATP-binding cassette domain-containing protein [uncultured Anaerococcus sp.]